MFQCAFSLLNDCDSDIRTTAASKVYKAFHKEGKLILLNVFKQATIHCNKAILELCVTVIIKKY